MSKIALSLAALLAAAAASSAQAAPRCEGSRDVRIVNGRIHTMDAKDTVVSSITIQQGRFVARGQAAVADPCLKVIDVHGHTVVPGLIDNHNHFILLSIRPGHDARLENAASIAGLLLTTEALVVDKPAEDEDEAGHGHSHGPGGHSH